MKTMKTWMMAVMMAISMAFAGGEMSAAPLTDNNVNPLNVARAFALKTPDVYYGFMSCEMLMTNGTFVNMQMEWRMDKSFAITNLMVNGTSIALPEPIYGLPMGEVGLARNVHLSIGARTKTGEFAGWGSLHEEVVVKGDSLVVTLIPASVMQVIPVDVSGYNGNIQITIEDFPYGYGWGINGDGKLYVELPPVGGSYHYIVRDNDGNVIGSGTIEPFHQTDVAEETYVGVSLLGNVVGAEFSQPDGLDSWTYIPSISFNCSVPTDGGTNVMAKVIFVDVGSGGLEVSLFGDFQVYVQSATGNNGDMPYLPLQDQSSSGPVWHQTRVSTVGHNAGKVVITIIPKPGNINPNPWVDLHRFYGSPSPNGGGKG